MTREGGRYGCCESSSPGGLILPLWWALDIYLGISSLQVAYRSAPFNLGGAHVAELSAIQKSTIEFLERDWPIVRSKHPVKIDALYI